MVLLFIARIFFSTNYTPSDRLRQELRTLEEVTLALKEACKKLVSFKHKTMDANISATAETLTPILAEIEYHPMDESHNLSGVIASEPHHTKKYGTKFVLPPKKNYMTTSSRRMQQLPKSTKWKPTTQLRRPIARCTTPPTRDTSNSSWTW